MDRVNQKTIIKIRLASAENQQTWDSEILPLIQSHLLILQTKVKLIAHSSKILVASSFLLEVLL